MTTYSARAYSAYGQLLGFLRPLSVEAGVVVNAVGEASVIVAQEGLPAWWKDVHYLDVWRYSDWFGRRQVPDVWNSAPQIWRWRDWIV